MAVVDGLTKARMLAIEANSVVDGDINESGNLILTRQNGETIDAGHVVGTPGVSITNSVIDANGDLIITYSNGVIVNVGHVEGSDAPAHQVEPHLSLYTPSGYSHGAWRNRVHAAKYGRTTTVTVVGSSSVAGGGASPKTNGFAHLLRDRFAAAGFTITNTGLAYAGTAHVEGDPRWTFSGSGVTSSQANLHADLASGAWAEYTDTVVATRVRVWYAADSDPFTVSIDGGSAVTVTPPGGEVGTSWVSNALTPGPHTVRITGSGTLTRLIGVDMHHGGANGIGVTVAGLSTSVTGTWAGNWLNYLNPLRNALRLPMSLVLIAVNGNDFTLGTPRATMAANLKHIIDGVRFFGGEALLVNMPVRVTVAPRTQEQWDADYAAHSSVLYDVADQTGVALIDMNRHWGPYSRITAAGMSADGIHPSTRGHAMYADAIFNVIGRT